MTPWLAIHRATTQPFNPTIAYTLWYMNHICVECLRRFHLWEKKHFSLFYSVSEHSEQLRYEYSDDDEEASRKRREDLQGVPIKTIPLKFCISATIIASIRAKLLVFHSSHNISCKFYWNNWFGSNYTCISLNCKFGENYGDNEFFQRDCFLLSHPVGYT